MVKVPRIKIPLESELLSNVQRSLQLEGYGVGGGNIRLISEGEESYFIEIYSNNIDDNHAQLMKLNQRISLPDEYSVNRAVFN